MKLGSMFGEILPLASFFVVNQSHGLYMAAIAAIATSALLIVIYRIREKRLARFIVFSTLVYAVLTAAAIFTEEKTYIKIQPSLFSFCFAAVLLGGVLLRRAMMKVFSKPNSPFLTAFGGCSACVGGCFFWPPGWPMKWLGARSAMMIGFCFGSW